MAEETAVVKDTTVSVVQHAKTGVTKPQNLFKQSATLEEHEYDEKQYSDLMKLYEGTLGKINEGEIV